MGVGYHGCLGRRSPEERAGRRWRCFLVKSAAIVSFFAMTSLISILHSISNFHPPSQQEEGVLGDGGDQRSAHHVKDSVGAMTQQYIARSLAAEQNGSNAQSQRFPDSREGNSHWLLLQAGQQKEKRLVDRGRQLGSWRENGVVADDAFPLSTHRNAAADDKRRSTRTPTGEGEGKGDTEGMMTASPRRQLHWGNNGEDVDDDPAITADKGGTPLKTSVIGQGEEAPPDTEGGGQGWRDRLRGLDGSAQTAGRACAMVYSRPKAERCQHAARYCRSGCRSLIDYTELHFCALKGRMWVSVPLLVAGVLTAFYLLAETAEEYFCPVVAKISTMLSLSPNTAGVTFLAFGNGAPDVFSSLAAFVGGNPKIGIGAIISAGTFVTAFVVGCVAMVAAPIAVRGGPFLRDVGFYVVAAVAVFLVYCQGFVALWQAVGFCVYYLFFVTITIMSDRRQKPGLGMVGVQTKQDLPQSSHHNPSPSSSSSSSSPPPPPPPPTPLLPPPPSLPPVVPSHSHQHPQATSAARRTSLPLLEVSPGIGDNMLAGGGLTIGGASALQQQQSKGGGGGGGGGGAISVGVFVAGDNFEDRGVAAGVTKKVPSRTFTSWRYWQEWSTTFTRMSVAAKAWHLICLPFDVLRRSTIPAVDDAQWNRLYGTINVVVCPLICLYACGPLIGFTREVTMVDTMSVKVPLWLLVLVQSSIMGVAFFMSTQYNRAPESGRGATVFIAFLMSIFWISSIASELLGFLTALGIIFHISPAILGVTVLAWGNSVGDLFADVSIARTGQPTMAIAGCFAGPMFNMLVGLGLALSIRTASLYPEVYKLHYHPNIPLSFGFLLCSLLGSLIFVTGASFRVTRTWGVCLISLYLAFMLASVVVETGVIVDVPS